jgi:hypothetical protein
MIKSILEITIPRQCPHNTWREVFTKWLGWIECGSQPLNGKSRSKRHVDGNATPDLVGFTDEILWIY